MKVCAISGDAVGGVRKHVHDILLAAPTDFNLLYIHSDVSDSAAQRDFVDLMHTGVKRIPLRIAKNPAFSDLKNILIIWNLCRKNGVDILHGHGSKGGLYARSVGFLMRKPVIFTPHGGSVHSRFNRTKRLLFAFVEYLLKFATTLFVFESHYTRTAFQKMAGNVPDCRALVSFNGVLLESFIPKTAFKGRTTREVRLLTVGLLSMVKGQDVAIHATAILHARGWQVSLDLCGDGESRQTLESLAANFHVEDLVKFHGDVEDVRPYYEACDIVLIPSRFESFGYVAVEAALMGRPIVASATGGLLETVLDGETGLCFPSGSPDALADAIERTLADVDATQRRIAAARARAISRFDVSMMTARLFSTYRQLGSR